MLRKWKFEMEIHPQSGQAIYLQIADVVIRDIHRGRLKPGDALPGSRTLAEQLQVNRNTVIEALHVLTAEGWLVAKERLGTFVSDPLPLVRADSSEHLTSEVESRSGLPAFRIKFDDGIPDSKIAPIAQLARAYRQVFNQKAKWQMMGYANELGDLEFRGQLAQMLNHQRAMHIDKHQICVTRGSQMAMYLTAHCLLHAGDCVVIENPGYKPAWKAFESAGVQLIAVDVEPDGLAMDQLRSHLQVNPRIKAIYVTPHRQYPTTVSLSLKKRRELVELANQYNFAIIEDDYDHEFHFGYRPILPLSSFPELKKFVYIGTLSKVVAPALRLGYLVTNDRALMEKVGNLRKIIDVQSDSMMEKAVLQLIQDGTIKKHIKKVSSHYKNKRDDTHALLNQYLKNKATFHLPEGGLAFWIVPNRLVDWRKICQALEKKGIQITHPEAYSFAKPVNGLRLGYATLSKEELREGIAALSQLL